MPFRRAKKNEDHLPASQREAADDGESDSEGQAMRGRGRESEDHLPPAERAASDDGGTDTEGQGFRGH